MEHFLALRLLLDTTDQPASPRPEWPVPLLPGEYAGIPDISNGAPPPALSLFCRSDSPYLGAEGSTGTVRQTRQAQFQDHACWQWNIEWDNGSGTLRNEQLWLHVLDEQHFNLYNAQGQCRSYALKAEEIIPPHCLWPEPLYMAVYQCTNATSMPDYLHQIEILEYDCEPLVQCSIGICKLEATHMDAHGLYHATLSWSLQEDACDAAPPTQICWRIHDGDRFDWVHSNGSATPYRWLRDI